MYVPLRHARTAECNRSIRKINTQVAFSESSGQSPTAYARAAHIMQPEISPPEDDSSLNTWQGRIANVSTRNFSPATSYTSSGWGKQKAGREQGVVSSTPPGPTASNKQPLLRTCHCVARSTWLARDLLILSGKQRREVRKLALPCLRVVFPSRPAQCSNTAPNVHGM
uniref:Uncharacterized protein n=1 Tax=Bionectria ochroleuca TaxID=29856 RepID=A0A8H7NP84_BIOOC